MYIYLISPPLPLITLVGVEEPRLTYLWLFAICLSLHNNLYIRKAYPAYKKYEFLESNFAALLTIVFRGKYGRRIRRKKVADKLNAKSVTENFPSC